MTGYQITFFTQQDRCHGHQTLAEWLLVTARNLGLPGATIVAGAEGFGHHRRIHSIRFFELSDQPVEVTMVATEEEAEKLFAVLKQEGVRLFYVKTPVEFGMLGE